MLPGGEGAPFGKGSPFSPCPPLPPQNFFSGPAGWSPSLSEGQAIRHRAVIPHPRQTAACTAATCMHQPAKKDATRGVLFCWLCSGVPKLYVRFPVKAAFFPCLEKQSHTAPGPLAAPSSPGTDARRYPTVPGRAITDPNKSFWEGWGELEGGRGDLFSKRAPFPPQKNNCRPSAGR